jgi:hypothetical protein
MTRAVLVLAVLIVNGVSISAESVMVNQTSIRGDSISLIGINESVGSSSASTKSENSNAALAPATNMPHTFSLTQAGPVTNSQINIGGIVISDGGTDRSAEFSITTVMPEAGSMLLLGTSLVAVCGAIRRKLKAN